MDYIKEINEKGFVVVPGLFEWEQLESFLLLIQKLQMNTDGPYAARDILRKIPEISRLIMDEKTKVILNSVLGPSFFAVRGLLFNKVPAANWKVAWHQDLAIAVKERKEWGGFGPWSVKAGITHCLAPDWLLEKMLAFRIHLDDCNETNGPLKVIPESHRLGRLNQKEISNYVMKTKPITCVVPKGGILLMRPLLIHSSSPASKPGNRRVIHLEFAVEDLPGGLNWFEKVS